MKPLRALIVVLLFSVVAFTQIPKLRTSFDVVGSTVPAECTPGDNVGIEWTEPSFAFGQSVVSGVPVDRAFWLSNRSSMQCTVNKVSVESIDGNTAFAILGVTFPVTLPPNGAVSFTVRFTPPTTVGTFAATVKME